MVVVATQYRCLVLYFLHNPKFGLSLDNGYQDLLAIFTHHDLDLPVTNPAFSPLHTWQTNNADSIVGLFSLVLIATR